MNELKVLVTDGEEYIGFQTFKVLQKLGFITVTFGNLVARWKDTIKFHSFEQGDLINKAARRSKLLKEHGLDLSVSFEN